MPKKQQSQQTRKPPRPPGFALGDRVRVRPEAPNDYRQRAGFITEIGPGRSEYRVEFDDGNRPTTGYVKAEWLQPAK